LRSLILGTAGHVDHGKTALVRVLTGVDTDRLKEEKERGITIELGFAPLEIAGRLRFGVVDVPGHEDFVRTMVAGAAGTDVVLLVVAADEGVMPQTREHLAIVELLGVPELVVALTKSDLVDADWLDLVDADVAELLAPTPYAHAARIATSSTAAMGLDVLTAALLQAADRVREHDVDDLVRLPLDRVFALQGTGTVVTGTLWSGTIGVGERVLLLPDGLDARVRSLQVHGRDVEAAHAGERTAVALGGEGADRARVGRGATLVTSAEWAPTPMLTARVRMLERTSWSLAPRQRVHIHHGTTEVLARAALLDAKEIGPGESGWVQFRLEEPITVRARDRLVIRAYSPMTTIGGGVVAEPTAPKRSRLEPGTAALLASVLDGDPAEGVRAALDLAGLAGVSGASLPVLTGLAPAAVHDALSQLGEACLPAGARVFGPSAREDAEAMALAAVDAAHAKNPLEEAVPKSAVRHAFPRWASDGLPDAIVAVLLRTGALESVDGGLRRPGHRPSLSADQEAARARLEAILRAGGLGAPSLDELPVDLRQRADLWPLLRRLEAQGALRQVADDIFLDRDGLDRAAARIRTELGGRRDLGPAAFKEILPVTRKRLLPLLGYFDTRGVTLRRGEGRDVPES
jgi:selenocysteine-specific elongation factor